MSSEGGGTLCLLGVTSAKVVEDRTVAVGVVERTSASRRLESGEEMSKSPSGPLE